MERLEEELEDRLYSYLKEKQGSAFTVGALVKRLYIITKNRKQKEYGNSNLQKILNNLRDKDLIKAMTKEEILSVSTIVGENDKESTQNDKRTYYWVPYRYLDNEYALPVNFVASKMVGGRRIQKKSSIGEFGVATIMLLIGIIFIGAAMAALPFSAAAALTLILVGVLLIVLSICIASNGECIWCCPA